MQLNAWRRRFFFGGPGRSPSGSESSGAGRVPKITLTGESALQVPRKAGGVGEAVHSPRELPEAIPTAYPPLEYGLWWAIVKTCDGG